MRDGRGLPVVEVVGLGIKVAGALETAHRAEILHRDVKPQNILITEFGEPALADFGVAMLQSSTQTTAGLFDFTTLHAAPELLEGGETSAATDVYELASSLYQLAAGRSAFRAYEGESPASVILRILRDPVQPLAAGLVPTELSDLLMYAMSKDKAARPRTAAEFAAELARIEADQGWVRTPFLVRDLRTSGPAPAAAMLRPQNAPPVGLAPIEQFERPAPATWSPPIGDARRAAAGPVGRDRRGADPDPAPAADADRAISARAARNPQPQPQPPRPYPIPPAGTSAPPEPMPIAVPTWAHRAPEPQPDATAAAAVRRRPVARPDGASTGLPADRLAVEVTETAVFGGGPARRRAARAARARRADRAGRLRHRHSSLGLLQTVPGRHPQGRQVLRRQHHRRPAGTRSSPTALIQVSDGLGLAAVAEGVETAEQAAGPLPARLPPAAGLPLRPPGRRPRLRPGPRHRFRRSC